jgi:hypothetical protein
MKKLIIALLCIVPLFAFAQRYPTGKGTFRTGGGGNYSQSDKGEYNLYKLQITPRLGYFVTDALLLGFQTNYTMTLDTNFTSAIKFTPQLKYFYTVNPHWFLIAAAEFGVDRTTVFSSPKEITDHSSFAVGPGVAYFYTRRIGFEIGTLYQMYLNPDDTYTNKFILEGGIVFNILNKNDLKKSNRQKGVELQETDDE